MCASIPSRTGAAVVVCHGSEGDRRGMLGNARALALGGFGVLLFDWPGHGESGGDVSFGAPQRVALEGAIDFLTSRTDVDSARVGALGFSMGGYTLAQVASADSRVKAVVLEGAFGDAIEQARAEYRRAAYGSRLGAILAVRGGMDVRDLRPIDVVGKIAPRPLVIVAGTADVIVPLELSRRLYDAAGNPKEFWIIENAEHGQYLRVDRTFSPRLRSFFGKALHVPEEAVEQSSKENTFITLLPGSTP